MMVKIKEILMALMVRLMALPIRMMAMLMLMMAMSIMVKFMTLLMRMVAMQMAMLMTSRQCLGIAGEEGGESRGGGNWSTEFDLLSL